MRKMAFVVLLALAGSVGGTALGQTPAREDKPGPPSEVKPSSGNESSLGSEVLPMPIPDGEEPPAGLDGKETPAGVAPVSPLDPTTTPGCGCPCPVGGGCPPAAPKPTIQFISGTPTPGAVAGTVGISVSWSNCSPPPNNKVNVAFFRDAAGTMFIANNSTTGVAANSSWSFTQFGLPAGTKEPRNNNLSNFSGSV